MSSVYFRVSKKDGSFEIESEDEYTFDDAIDTINRFHQYVYHKIDSGKGWKKGDSPIPMFATIKDLEKINAKVPFKDQRMSNTIEPLHQCNFTPYINGGHCNGLCGAHH